MTKREKDKAKEVHRTNRESMEEEKGGLERETFHLLGIERGILKGKRLLVILLLICFLGKERQRDGEEGEEGVRREKTRDE